MEAASPPPTVDKSGITWTPENTMAKSTADAVDSDAKYVWRRRRKKKEQRYFF
jgi:hypothetical protein